MGKYLFFYRQNYLFKFNRDLEMNEHNPFSLEGKTILITGASSGIGKAIAIECSKMRANLIITGRNEHRLNETFCQLKGEKHIQIIADLFSDKDIESLMEKLPLLNGIVHCAGIADPVPFQFITSRKLTDIFSVNFFSPVLMTKEIIKRKLISKKSSIVFISSISGTVCSSVAGNMYSATKGAINGMVKGMAIDLAPKFIRVNTIQPGMINTSIFDDGRVTEEQLQEDIKKYPLKRYGQPEEVAYAAIYLLSDASAWVTGSNLLIDGGYTLL